MCGIRKLHNRQIFIAQTYPECDLATYRAHPPGVPGTHTVSQVPTRCPRYLPGVPGTYPVSQVPTRCPRYLPGVPGTHPVSQVPTRCPRYPPGVPGTHPVSQVPTRCPRYLPGVPGSWNGFFLALSVQGEGRTTCFEKTGVNGFLCLFLYVTVSPGNTGTTLINYLLLPGNTGTTLINYLLLPGNTGTTLINYLLATQEQLSSTIYCYI